MNRRQFLKSGLLGGVGAPFNTGFKTVQRRNLKTSKPLTPHNEIDDTYIQYPKDPFIQTISGDFPLDSETITAVHGLHPDVLSAAELWHNGLTFAKETNVPATSPLWFRFDFADEDTADLFNRLREENNWTYPDGTPVEAPEGIIGAQYDGSQYQYARQLVPSVFAPGFFDVITTQASEKYDRGYAASQYGNIRAVRKDGLDFSVWAQDAFRDYLQTLSDDRLETLGIDEPGEFDIRAYIDQAGITPENNTHPAEDAVFREYLRHNHRGIKSYLSDLKAWIQESYPQRSIPFTINQPIGDPRLAEVAVAETYASDLVDVVSAEDFRTLPAVELGLGRTGRTVPDKDIRDYVYKLLLATTRENQPVFVFDPFGASYYSDISRDDDMPMLLRLQTAEAYAMGARRKLTIRDEPLTWKQQGGTLPDVLKEFIDFAWAHQRFLKDVESDNRVTLIWSLPTLLWNTIPQWFRNAKQHTHTFIGTATLLREAQIPYDVTVFGYPELWPDGQNLEGLSDYDTVILPAIESISDEQLAALKEHLSNDGVLLTSGSPPDRTEEFGPRADEIAVFEDEGALILDTNPGKQRLTGDGSGTGLIEALNENGIHSHLPNAGTDVGVNRLAQPGSSRQIIHLLNYDYDRESDSFDQKTDIQLDLRGIDSSFETARYYTPQGITDLEVSLIQDRAELTIPELTEWGFVVLAPSKTQIEDSTSSETARTSVSEAEAAIERAREAGIGESPRIIRADVERKSAETALEYDSTSLAKVTAHEAVQLVKSIIEASPTPETPSSSPTDTEFPTTEPPESNGEASAEGGSPTNTTEVSLPGFDVLLGVIGLGIAILLRHLYNMLDEER